MPVIPFQNNPVLEIARYRVGDAAHKNQIKKMWILQNIHTTLGQNIVLISGENLRHPTR